MNCSIENIEYEWLFRETGDPFVDAGGYVLKILSETFQNDSIIDLIKKITDLYVNSWTGKINQFFLNSTITNPAYKGQKKIDKTIEYFQSLICDEGSVDGICMITGRHCKVFRGGRDNMVLSGSKKLVNYFSQFQTGAMLSKEVIIRNFFLPLACESLDGKIALISCTNYSVSNYFINLNLERNLNNWRRKMSTGILRSSSNSINTTFFRYLDKITSLKKFEFGDVKSSITMYLFSNFAAKPNIDIFELSTPTLKFYRFVSSAKYKDVWNKLISRNYLATKDKKTYKYQEDINGYYIDKEKGKVKYVKESDFQYWDNRIYQKLLDGKSILPEILKFIRLNNFHIEIVELYSKKILKMKEETINKIKEMADFIVKNNDETKIAKAIKMLDSIDNSYLLRRFILNNIVKANYRINDEAIITIKEYTEYLFPDIDSWKETRDLLLIAIFEQLHEKKIKLEID